MKSSKDGLIATMNQSKYMKKKINNKSKKEKRNYKKRNISFLGCNPKKYPLSKLCENKMKNPNTSNFPNRSDDSRLSSNQPTNPPTSLQLSSFQRYFPLFFKVISQNTFWSFQVQNTSI